MARKYSNTASLSSLTVSINSSATSINLATVTGFPSTFSYSLTIDPDTASAEVVTVTAVAGLVATVTRGQDGTSAVTHSLGAVVRHDHSARDFSEPQVHIDATAAHGATGAVVGTTNTQTLTNKDISSGTNTLPAAVVTLTSTQTLTNKTLTSPAVTTLTLDTVNISSAWNPYTPAWTATGTNPTLGDGSIAGYYKQIGKTVVFSIELTRGGTTTLGSGTYSWSLPVAARMPAVAAGAAITLVGRGANQLGIGEINTSTTVRFLLAADSTGLTNVNIAMGGGGTIRIGGTYEAA